MSIAANSNVSISGFIDLSSFNLKAEKKGRKTFDLPNDKSRLLVAISSTVWMLHFNHIHNIILLFKTFMSSTGSTITFCHPWVYCHYVEGRTEHNNREKVGLSTNKQENSLQITRPRTDRTRVTPWVAGLVKREMCVMFSAWRDERDNVELKYQFFWIYGIQHKCGMK